MATIVLAVPLSSNECGESGDADHGDLLEAIVGGVLGSLIVQIGGAFVAVDSYATTAVAFTRLRDPPGGTDHNSEPTDDWGSSSDGWNTD